MAKQWILPASLLAAAAIGFGGTSFGAGAGDGVRCEILVKDAGGALTLQPTASAAGAVAGQYEFALESSGGGNSSRSVQGGDFSVGGGKPSVLSEATVGKGGGLARLTLHWNGGTTSCEKKF